MRRPTRGPFTAPGQRLYYAATDTCECDPEFATTPAYSEIFRVERRKNGFVRHTENLWNRGSCTNYWSNYSRSDFVRISTDCQCRVIDVSRNSGPSACLHFTRSPTLLFTETTNSEVSTGETTFTRLPVNISRARKKNGAIENLTN